MQKFQLYSSLTRKKEIFKPLKDKTVLMYVCGITPYDTTHLGHAFTYVLFDVLVRYLRFLGYKVKYVQNVTDIDDDILKKAKETGQNWKKLGDFWTKQYLKDMESLNILLPTKYVKATDSIPTIVLIVKKLLKEGLAYKSEANVYFRVSKLKDYGKLSKYNASKMKSLLSERGGNPNDLNKENPLDFVLWQGKLPGEPFWESPYGAGRPGWHIECSSMIYKYLGKQIDIHGGGADLIYPHHESEIAQSESFTDKKPFTKLFIHTAMVKYKKNKMSKSLDNLIMIKDLLNRYSANAIRFVILSHHYRKTWSFDEKEIISAERKWKKISGLPYLEKKPNLNNLSNFFKHLNSDFDTKSALSEIMKLTRNKNNSSDVRAALYILGFNLK